MSTIRWKESPCPPKVEARVAYSVFEDIRKKHGAITAKAVVEDSRPESAPLHDEFEWDDAKAAQLQRESHARHLIRSLVVRIRPEDPASPETRALEVARDGRNGRRAYTPIGEIMADPRMRQEVLMRALDELIAWQNRYKTLKEFASVFEAIDSIDASELKRSA